MDLSKQALDGDPRLIMTGTLVKVRRTRMSMLLILKKKIERFFRQHYESLVIVVKISSDSNEEISDKE